MTLDQYFCVSRAGGTTEMITSVFGIFPNKSETHDLLKLTPNMVKPHDITTVVYLENS